MLYLVIFGVTEPVFIKFAKNVGKILPLNTFKSELPYSNPFWNISLPNKGHFANFVQNWLPWQRPLRNQKSLIIFNEILTIW